MTDLKLPDYAKHLGLSDKTAWRWGKNGKLPILRYKCEREGKILVEVDRFFPSSKTCHHCYYQVSEHKLDVRSWTCLSCANVQGRAVNAARNIPEKGLRLLALGTSATANGEEVSPKRGRKALVRRSSVKLEAPPSAGGKAE